MPSPSGIAKLLAACVTGVALLLAAPAQAGTARQEYVPDELLIKFREEVPEHLRQTLVALAEGRVMRKLRLIRGARVKVPARRLQAALNYLRSLPEVEDAQPNYLRYADTTSNDVLFSSLWGLPRIGAPAAWDITTGSPDVVVAVIDSGLALTHPEFVDRVWTNAGEIAGNGIDDDGNGYIDDVHGWDFANDDNNPNDVFDACGGHGTHTAGIVGAAGNNFIGVTGVNWNVTLMPLKALKASGGSCVGTDADIIAAIEYAADQGVRISNNSYGGAGFNSLVQDAIRASNSIFVAAAGNAGSDNDILPSYPASFELSNVVSVAATTELDALASFSNYGLTSVDLAAPGVGILSTVPSSGYASKSGTSMASPHVAGAAALLLASDPSLTNLELIWRLLHGVDDLGLPVATRGRLNVHTALTLPPPVVSVRLTPVRGLTTLSPGDRYRFRLVLRNTSSETVSVQVAAVLVRLDGKERVLSEDTVTLAPGARTVLGIVKRWPANLPPGTYQVSGRATVADVSFDEDLVTYTVVP